MKKRPAGEQLAHFNFGRLGALLAALVVSVSITTLSMPSTSYGQANNEPAAESASNGATGDDFSISLPTDPVSIRPGQEHETSLRIVNRSENATVFRISGVVVEPQDEGAVAVTPGSDAWSDSVRAPETVNVPGSDYVDVPITFQAPIDASVDIHLVGFLVQPVHDEAAEGVEVRTQAVSFLPVEIPGVAKRSIAIRNFQLPRFVFAKDVKGSFEVYNSGESAVRFRGQVFLDSGLSDRNFAVIQAGDPSSRLLLPVDRFRTLDYQWKAGFLPAVLDPTIEVNFDDGPNGLRAERHELPVTIVIPPATTIGFLAVAGVLVLTLLARAFRRMRSRRKPVAP